MCNKVSIFDHRLFLDLRKKKSFFQFGYLENIAFYNVRAVTRSTVFFYAAPICTDGCGGAFAAHLLDKLFQQLPEPKFTPVMLVSNLSIYLFILSQSRKEDFRTGAQRHRAKKKERIKAR